MNLIDRAREAFERRTKYRWDRVNVTLIVSTGRTGTEFLARFFNEHFEGVAGRHEPPMDMFELGAGRLRGKYNHEEGTEYFYSHRYRLLQELVNAGKDTYVESNLNLSLVLDLAENVFPNLKIIHVVRDPKTCIRSYYNKSPDDSGTLYFMGENDFRQRVVPADFPNDPFYAESSSMNRFEKVCWYWSKYNSIVSDYFDRNTKGNTLLVKYEDLFLAENKTEQMNALIGFMGISDRKKTSPEAIAGALARKSNFSRNGELIGEYETWTDEMKASFSRIVSVSAQRYGYK